ncbi:MAG: T9SS type A sorting domain-containing protein [Chitinophagales bacterium]|nr:T9SS type A sorting domain-containing protein [Chitinophagales bacterium]
MKKQLRSQSKISKSRTPQLLRLDIKLAPHFITLLMMIFSLTYGQSMAQGTWTPVTSRAIDPNGGGMLLLSDGTVMAKTFSGGDSYGNIYDKLTPDSHGSYINGTWTRMPAMHNTRLYFSSQILMDGRVYVAGGEYGSGGSLGETFDPLTNVWTMAPNQGQRISDANSEILPDGKVLQALVTGSLKGTDIYDPVTNKYSTGPTARGIHNESAWVKLPDNSILFVDRLSTASERYIPSLNQWIADATVPVSLYDSFGDETGAAVLLPDGRAFFIGSSGHTAYYSPSGTTSPGTWTAGPNIPSGKGTPDAPAAMMVNGKVLCAVSPVPTSSNHFPSPTSFYEFDYIANTFTSITTPRGGASINVPCYVTGMLDLPDGSVLFAMQDSTRYYVYSPDGIPTASGKPVINTINQQDCGAEYTLTGTLFNGISEGAYYGDDWQMASNYPIIRLTSGTNIYYARTYNWNSTGVQRGSAADTAKFTLPVNLPQATYSMVVTSNGFSSDAVSFTVQPGPDAKITPLGSLDICGTGSVILEANSGDGYTYQWLKRGNPISGATDRAYTATTKGFYKVVVTNSNGCSKTSNGTKVINSCMQSAKLDLTEADLTIFPNPAETKANVHFTISNSSHVLLRIFDMSGKKVFTILNQNLAEGEYSLDLNASQFTKGVYLVNLITDSATQNQKLIIQ